jgi:pyruvate/2-oxoglutarate dehydrogenase complex dihydrolipoamide acyltransferase (E2) component
MPIDLQELHAAGAEVAGEHADAWLRLRGAKSAEFATLHGGIVGAVRALHARLGRRITPADLNRQPDEHPPTDQVARPVALEPKPEPETAPMPDALLAELNQVLADRPRGACKALAAELGIDSSSLNYWRTSGKVPESRRDAVRKWIDKPTVVAITEKSAPKPKKIKRVTTNLPPPATRIAPPASRIELRQLLNALGLTPIEVWVRTGETMHKTQAIVLPS